MTFMCLTPHKSKFPVIGKVQDWDSFPVNVWKLVGQETCSGGTMSMFYT